MVEGGCLCGAIRYSIIGEPVVQLYYCSDCRKVSGTDAYAAYVVPRANLTLEKGQPVSYSVTAKSGRTNTRNFCASWQQTLGRLRYWVSRVSGGSFDDPEHFSPTMVHCESGAPSWSRIPAELESLPEG